MEYKGTIRRTSNSVSRGGYEEIPPQPDYLILSQTQTQTQGSRPSTPGKYSSPSTGEAVIIPPVVNWRTPASMLCLLLLGMGCAIGQHMFYKSIDKRQAEFQQRTTRIGTGLAYLSKFSLAAMGWISRDQWLWYTLRTRFLTLGGIDAMFGVTSNISYVFNRDVLRRAKVSTAMAVVAWIFPLLPVLTPSAISIVSTTRVSVAPCTVPSLEFRFNADKRIIGLNMDWDLGNALYLSNNSFYDRPNAKGKTLFSMPAMVGRVTAGSTKPFGPSLCKDGAASCTYSIQFEGPSVNCTEISIDDPSASWNGAYNFSQCEPPPSGPVVIPIFQLDKNLTSFWALASVRGVPGARTACRKLQGYVCQASVANYTVEQLISGDVFQDPNITVDTLYPIMDSHDNISRSSDPIYPNYNNIPNWILFDVLTHLLAGKQFITIEPNSTEVAGNGNAQRPTESTLYSNTEVDGTTLMRSTWDPVHPLGPAVERIVHEMVVSLLSEPLTSYYTNTTVNCSSTEVLNVYKYNSLMLGLLYMAALSVSSLMTVLGTLALIWNGVASDSSFSTILRTTRNSILDRELKGGCLGGSPLPDKFKKLELKFGVLPASWDDSELKVGNGVRRVAIGIAGQVTPIEKGRQYC